MSKKTFEEFKEKSKLEERARERFGHTPVYDAAMEIGKRLAGGFSRQNLRNDYYVKGMLELILSVAPHKTIVDNLKKLADEGNKNALGVMAAFFGDTRIAETASLGQVAEERIRAIDALEKAIRAAPPVEEPEMQEMLERAPWLIDPQWTVLQANQTLRTFRHAFEEEHERRTGEKIKTTTTEGDSTRPDFIMLPIGTKMEVVEIKRPGHRLDAQEYKRLYGYIEELEKFLEENGEYAEAFSGIHATLVCNGVNLTGTDMSSYEGEVNKGRIQHKTWEDMLLRTKRVHEDFIKARDRFFRESSEVQ